MKTTQVYLIEALEFFFANVALKCCVSRLAFAGFLILGKSYLITDNLFFTCFNLHAL